MAAEKATNDRVRDGVTSQPVRLSPTLSHDSNLEHGKPRAVDHTDEDEEFTYEEQRKIVHRIDRRLVVILGILKLLIGLSAPADTLLGFMYCVSLIDRGNMPNAVRYRAARSHGNL
jgi:hypothetical protein